MTSPQLRFLMIRNRWTSKECCLPKGGPQAPPPPPQGTNCPPTSYYWEDKQGCCAPRHPPPPNHPPPQCPKGWTWYPAVHRCHETPTPPTPPPSKPSSRPDHDHDHGYGWGDHDDHDGHHRRRSLKARISPCPTGLDACPVSSLGGDYECLDTTTELESCGGCTSLQKGQDCTRIEGAWNVGCHQGSCIGKYFIFPPYTSLPNRRFSVHLRWRFQHWRRWKILRPALILLLVGDPRRKATKYTPYRQPILELFPFFLGQFSNIPTPYSPLVITKEGSAYLLLFMGYFMDKLALKVHTPIMSLALLPSSPRMEPL